MRNWPYSILWLKKQTRRYKTLCRLHVKSKYNVPAQSLIVFSLCDPWFRTALLWLPKLHMNNYAPSWLLCFIFSPSSVQVNITQAYKHVQEIYPKHIWCMVLIAFLRCQGSTSVLFEDKQKNNHRHSFTCHMNSIFPNLKGFGILVSTHIFWRGYSLATYMWVSRKSSKLFAKDVCMQVWSDVLIFKCVWLGK